MRKLFYLIAEHLKLLFNPIIINAFVFYDKFGAVCHENWGDDLNYFFLRDIVKRPLVMFNRTSLAFRMGFKNYLVIGSSIDMLCKPSTEVWGAGIIDGTKSLKVKPKRVYAVRGPLTRDKLIAEGVDCPAIYGDPALLCSLYYRPQVPRRYKYGIISHVSNQELVNRIVIDDKTIVEREDVLVINMRQYEHWHDIIDQVCSCEAILSASLHGLIVAEAYNVPNVWIEFGESLIGKHFKFHDFFLSIHKDREMPLMIENFSMEGREIDEYLSKWEKGTIDLEPLLQACPFTVRNI